MRVLREKRFKTAAIFLIGRNNLRQMSVIAGPANAEIKWSHLGSELFQGRRTIVISAKHGNGLDEVLIAEPVKWRGVRFRP